jgi:hypothetical protein
VDQRGDVRRERRHDGPADELAINRRPTAEDARCEIVECDGLGHVVLEVQEARVLRVQGRVSIPFRAEE